MFAVANRARLNDKEWLLTGRTHVTASHNINNQVRVAKKYKLVDRLCVDTMLSARVLFLFAVGLTVCSTTSKYTQLYF